MQRDGQIASVAAEERARLDHGFREWVASHPIEPREGAQKIDWEQVVAFDDRVHPSVRDRLRTALSETTLLHESLFLLFDGVLLDGSELLPGGIWVTHLGAGHGKTVVRLAIRTASGRAYEIVVKVMRQIRPEEAAEEVDWMIRLGTRERTVRLVPEFGGFWPENAPWSEEYISNETVLGTIRRMTAPGDPERTQRLVQLWPHLAWSALATFIEFWQRSVRRYHAWLALNPDASLQARAMMLQELYETYTLQKLEAIRPEVRIRFFRMTVFARARPPLAAELDALIRADRDAPLSLESLLRRMTVLHQTVELDEEERYFLARMSYSHLAPAQKVRLELLTESGEALAELVEEVHHNSALRAGDSL